MKLMIKYRDWFRSRFALYEVEILAVGSSREAKGVFSTLKSWQKETELGFCIHIHTFFHKETTTTFVTCKTVTIGSVQFERERERE